MFIKEKSVLTITGNHENGSLFVTVPDSMAKPLTAFFNEFVASAVLGLVDSTVFRRTNFQHF